MSKSSIKLFVMLLLPPALLYFAPTAYAVQLAVPSYFNPGDSNYSALIDAGKKIAIDMIDIGNGEINPNDGATYDNEPLGPWISQSQELHTAGAQVFFYVHSSYGARSISLLEGDIESGESAGLTIDGVFVDEADTSWSNTGSTYYLTLYRWIKTNYPATVVVINPGTVPDGPNWMTACDIVMDFEDTYAHYNGVFIPSWVNNYPSTRFWNAAISTPKTTAAVDACFATAAANNTGYLYVTDLTASQNTYGSLPNATIWNEELKDAVPTSAPDAPTGLTASPGNA